MNRISCSPFADWIERNDVGFSFGEQNYCLQLVLNVMMFTDVYVTK